jgi:hypothetical protein
MALKERRKGIGWHRADIKGGLDVPELPLPLALALKKRIKRSLFVAKALP